MDYSPTNQILCMVNKEQEISNKNKKQNKANDLAEALSQEPTLNKVHRKQPSKT
jgi:hypothetical protein